MKFALAALLAVAPISAAAQPMCMTRAEMLDHLTRGYKEKPTALGLSSAGGVYEVLTSRNGKTWTIILTLPTGISCVIAAGRSWHSIVKGSDL
jgi:hypothetical protein